MVDTAYELVINSLIETRKEISDRLPSFIAQAQAAERKYQITGDEESRAIALEFYKTASFYDPGNQTALGGIERLSDDWDF